MLPRYFRIKNWLKRSSFIHYQIHPLSAIAKQRPKILCSGESATERLRNRYERARNERLLWLTSSAETSEQSTQGLSWSRVSTSAKEPDVKAVNLPALERTDTILKLLNFFVPSDYAPWAESSGAVVLKTTALGVC